MSNQATFLSCYRGRQSALHHAAYMRMSKVLLLQTVLARLNLSLEHKRIFDYGFGAGTFFRYCPKSSHLFGVELDEVNVTQVSRMLSQRGFPRVCLQPLNIDTWSSHPLLQTAYDLILCSHILEHIPEPAFFLKRMKDSLAEGGVFIGLVPINERKQDPHHVRAINLATLKEWLVTAQLRLIDWIEEDPLLYWLQPVFTHESGWRHGLAQLLSLALGLPATALGPQPWFRFSRVLAKLSYSKPTQAAFVLRA